MAIKPNVYPNFCTSIDEDGVGTITDPTSNQKNAQPPSDIGYSVSEGVKLQQFLPRQLINHLFGLINNWVKWFDEQIQNLSSGLSQLGSDLDDLNTKVDELDSGDIENTSNVAGTTVTDALNNVAEMESGSCVVKFYFDGFTGEGVDVNMNWRRSGNLLNYIFDEAYIPEPSGGATSDIFVDYISGQRPKQAQGNSSMFSILKALNPATGLSPSILLGDTTTVERMFKLGWQDLDGTINFSFSENENVRVPPTVTTSFI